MDEAVDSFGAVGDLQVIGIGLAVGSKARGQLQRVATPATGPVTTPATPPT